MNRLADEAEVPRPAVVRYEEAERNTKRARIAAGEEVEEEEAEEEECGGVRGDVGARG